MICLTREPGTKNFRIIGTLVVLSSAGGSLNIPDCQGLNSSILEQSENNAWQARQEKAIKIIYFENNAKFMGENLPRWKPIVSGF